MRSRRFRSPRASWPSSLAFVLLAVPLLRAGAQAAAATTPSQWQAWTFARLGPVKTSLPGSPVFGSLAFGVAASRGAIVGMVRATDNEYVGFEDNPPPGEHDYAALAGMRSRSDRLFVVGAVGLARSGEVRDYFGELVSDRRLAPAFDLSAHADYVVAGLSVAVSGVLGPPPARFVAASLGGELGWFGSR